MVYRGEQNIEPQLGIVWKRPCRTQRDVSSCGIYVLMVITLIFLADHTIFKNIGLTPVQKSGFVWCSVDKGNIKHRGSDYTLQLFEVHILHEFQIIAL